MKRAKGPAGWPSWMAVAVLPLMCACATTSKQPPSTAAPALPPSSPEVAGPVEPGDNGSPRVTTDGGGHWVAVWHSSDTLGGTLGDDFDILVARSTDDGTSWTAPVPLNTNAATDSGHDFHAQVATDGAGHWVAVWESEDTLGGTIGADVDILVSRSTDAGATWTAPAALNSYAATDSGDDLRPCLLTDGAGHWVVVWHDEDPMGGPSGKDADIVFARSTDDGATWTPVTPLNTDAATDKRSDGFPRLATDGTGRWVAVWSGEDLPGGPYGHDADILSARSSDHGATWTAPAPLNTNAATDIGFDMHPQIATDTKGLWIAVWQSYDSLDGAIGEDADILVARSTDAGASWTAPAPLNVGAATDAHYDLTPSLATDRNGHWVVAWVFDDSWGETPGTDIDLHVSHSTDRGMTWTAPVPLNPSAASDAGQDDALDLATDRAGRWIALWRSNVALDGTVVNVFNVLVARSTDGGATWAIPASEP